MNAVWSLLLCQWLPPHSRITPDPQLPTIIHPAPLTCTLNWNQGIGGVTSNMNVLALSAGTEWRLAAITQRYPTDSTATTIMHQGLCGVYKCKLFSKQQPLNNESLQHSHEQRWLNKFNSSPSKYASDVFCDSPPELWLRCRHDSLCTYVVMTCL